MLSAEEVSTLLEKRAEGPLDGGLFRAHFDNLPGPAYIWRRCGDDFELIAHNRAALGLANGDVRELLGRRMRELFKDRPDIVESICRCADEQTVMVQETDLTFVSGVTRRMLMTRVPLSRDIVVGHMEDVTDRHVSDEELKASERRFRALFESHPDLVFRMDVRGKYLDLHVPEGAALPWRPPSSATSTILATLFPYTTLFRSSGGRRAAPTLRPGSGPDRRSADCGVRRAGPRPAMSRGVAIRQERRRRGRRECPRRD